MIVGRLKKELATCDYLLLFYPVGSGPHFHGATDFLLFVKKVDYESFAVEPILALDDHLVCGQ
jgi:hypothetical protein